MRHLLDQLEAAADEREVAVRADEAVEAGGGERPLGDNLAHCRPRGQEVPPGGHRVRERGERPAELL